jgi:hypothetical protein
MSFRESVGLISLGLLWIEALLVAGSVWGSPSPRPAACAFIGADVALCSAVTGLALWPPVFGPVSTFGAVLCLAFFLAVTPAGVWMRDRSASLRSGVSLSLDEKA